MSRRGLALVAGYIAAWTAVWWFATAPARESSAVLARLEHASPHDAGPILSELTAIYADSPRQAGGDYAANVEMRSLIAAAAAPVPDCASVVEDALDTLDDAGRLNVVLSLAVNGPPTLDEQGRWLGNDPFHPRAGAVPILRRRLDVETSRTVAVAAALALRASGDHPAPEEIFARASILTHPLAARSAELIVLADQPGGWDEIRRALRDSLVPDDAATSMVTSGAMERDPDWKTFALAWAIDRRHAAAAGGAFPTLFDAYPNDRDRLWANVSSIERGKRVPMMLAMMTRYKWPSEYRLWWMGIFDEERKVVPDLEARLAEGDLQNFGRWASDEKDPGAASAIRAVQERLHEISNQKSQKGR